MCLVVKKEDFEIKVAKEDIKCFKVVYKINNWSFSSMFQSFIYRFQHYKGFDFSEAVEDLENAYRIRLDEVGFVLQRPDLLETAEKLRDCEKLEEYYCFGYGGFHSFSDLDKSDILGTELVGIECIIPKGSRYVEGIDYVSDKKAYFSEEITIVREVNFNKN